MAKPIDVYEWLLQMPLCGCHGREGGIGVYIKHLSAVDRAKLNMLSSDDIKNHRSSRYYSKKRKGRFNR
jgi:hypothetical protein